MKTPSGHPCSRKNYLFLGLLFFFSHGFAQTKLGPFQLQPRQNNPLREPLLFSYQPSPVLLDLDDDADLDLVVGSYSGASGYGIQVYLNEGSAESPAFRYLSPSENPFYYVINTSYVAITPTFADFDEDGDHDLLVGFNTGALRYYRNEGDLNFDEQTTAWNPADSTGNPFLGIFAGYYSSPHAVDYDNDGDIDVLLGTYAYEDTYNSTVHLYVNDGNLNFTHSFVDGVNPSALNIAPTTVDYDQDGDLDIITGEESGLFRWFVNQGDWTFEEAEPATLNALGIGTYTVPVFGDMNQDGEHDMIVGTDPATGYYTVMFVQNNGGNAFEVKNGMHDPFGGLDVSNEAAPYFTDVDEDGDDDILIGNNNNYITYLKNEGGVFVEAEDTENPFAAIETGDNFSFSYVDIDGDGGRDIVGASEYNILFYKNVEGSYILQDLATGPFAAISTDVESKADFADIDSDGDFDLVLSDESNKIDEDTGAPIWGNVIRFFENTGTPDAPVFEERTGTENPFDSVFEEYYLYPRFTDIDHDGDLDALIGEGGDIHVEMPESNEFLFFENTGSPAVFEFVYRGDIIPQYDNAEYPSPAFTDFDNDGDLDIFQGDWSGRISYYKNENPAPVLTLNATPVSTEDNIGSFIVDPLLTLADSDQDEIAFVEVTISNFNNGDTLTYEVPLATPQPEIISNFNDLTGTLTISGKADVDFYQSLLRTLEYHFKPGTASMRTSRIRTSSIVAIDEVTPATSQTKVITLTIKDADFTSASSRSRNFTISAAPNAAPEITDHTLATSAGKFITFDLDALISDPNGSADIDATSVRIITPPSSGAVATINSNHELNVNYTGLSYTGSETLSVEVCDLAGLCAQNVVTIDVTNTAPVFNDHDDTVVAGSSIVIDLSTVFSDADDNIVASTLAITQAPASGAEASLTNNILEVNYSGVAFTGIETLTINICDIAGSCDAATITLNVTNSLPTFEAGTSTAIFGSLITVDLTELIADTDNNIVWSTLEVIEAPPSGAVASIDSNGILSVDYGTDNFAGTEILTIRVCDVTGSCVENTITITITNTSPLLASATATLVFGGTSSISLDELLSDSENNLDLGSLKIQLQPASGAEASIDANNDLLVNYADVNFAGTESVTVEVCDRAGACTQNDISFTITNTAPVLASATLQVSFGSSGSIWLIELLSDNENNIDASSLKVTEQPASGALASVDENSNLLINYDGINFAGSETVTIEICDLAGACVQNNITISVNNNAPVMNPEPVSTKQGSSVSIDLLAITSDTDNNLDPQSFEVVSTSSQAEATINNGVLTLDYSGRTFVGVDQITIRVCDQAGACTESIISIEVNIVSEVVVFNAVAPNGTSADNRYLHIDGLPSENKVVIFNRWGDQVYEVSHYDNESRKFTGVNNNGNALSSGTYFYKIEYRHPSTNDLKTLTGYLSLKQ